MIPYYLLFVILFSYAVFSESEDYDLYITTGASADALVVRDSRFQASIQPGTAYDLGVMYAHPAGFLAGLSLGRGMFKSSVTDEYVMYRGFDYTRLAVSTGWLFTRPQFYWLALVEAFGAVGRYDVSVQEFFFPGVSLVPGIGLGGLHRIFITLPAGFQFRKDLDLSFHFGLAVRLHLNSSFRHYKREHVQ